MQAYINLNHENQANNYPEEELPIFFSGCDFSCPYCNVKELLKFNEQFLIDINSVKKFIDDNYVTKKSIVFTGGEPCLQRQALLNLARHVKKMGLRTVLETNGASPNALKSLLMSEIIDEVRMDVKCSLSDEKFEKVTKSKTFFVSSEQITDEIRKSFGILKEYDKKIEIVFTTTIIPSLVFKKEEIIEIGEQIKNIRSVWQLRRFTQSSSATYVDPKFSDISPPTMNFLQSLKEHVEGKYPSLVIEVK